MMTPYHIHCGAVVRTLPGVSEVPGSSPRGGIFSPFFLIRPITITLFFFSFYSGWNLGVAVLGTCIYYGGDFQTIFFLLSVSAQKLM